MSHAHTTFVRAFEKLSNEVEFKEGWKNGTGYFDGAVKDKVLEVGERARCTDPHGRRMILVGTPFGTAVAFERYVDSEDSSKVIVSNMPRAARMMVADGAMNENDIMNSFGMDSMNIGTNLQWIIDEGKKLSA